jgi:valyl-tRNA synthetase
MLDKTYRPGTVEKTHYERWEKAGAFACGRDLGATPYTIVIPPPNVTGSLHIGHALNSTLQDILIRFERMRQRDVLWQPGMDHAGIATQMVVERRLEADNLSRKALGREKFVQTVWDWKAESGGTILGQLKRLGASCDWSRERFTMDDGLSEAVRKVFVDLYREGLIYKDQRLVNWDPKLQTAISDLEVQPRETEGHLWYFKYPVEGLDNTYITVATTRPETMLGDTAVAVHPDDPRYRDLIGKYCILPLVGRRIPIVADEYADPEQGSGAVKITPAHDFNDFEVGRRHDLEMINIFDIQACINDNAPQKYRTMDRFVARKAVVADMEAGGYLDRIEPHRHKVPYGDRGGVPVEPYLTVQWYVDAATLAKPAIEAVEQGRVKFVPANWDKTYFEWMRNIQPWCISRQLWWGHRIPAWYGPDGEIFVAHDEASALEAAEAHYGAPTELTQDEDVLDTWFSSALWPFSTLGWPGKTPEVARYYPTNVLVTGFDIIFFWVARMMMFGIHFMHEPPFKTVYVHALVRDEQGQKMSKSKGNVIDPLELIDRFGGDALRFTLASLAAPGSDIKLSLNRVESARNFATKLWNAARFCEINECMPVANFDPAGCTHVLNRWIVGETAVCARNVTAAIESFRFHEAAQTLYHFIWGTFCDWHVEFSKSLLTGSDEAARDETRAVTGWALCQILRMLHPFMPFITEELWTRFGDSELLIHEEWPQLGAALDDSDARVELAWVVDLISGIRSLRAEMNVPPGAKIAFMLIGANPASRQWLATHEAMIVRMARLGAISAGDTVPKGAVQFVHGEAVAALLIADAIDIVQETARLEKAIGKSESEAVKLEKKLGNAQFLAKAPPAVVAEQRDRLAAEQATRAKLSDALTRLAAVQ